MGVIIGANQIFSLTFDGTGTLLDERRKTNNYIESLVSGPERISHATVLIYHGNPTSFACVFNRIPDRLIFVTFLNLDYKKFVLFMSEDRPPGQIRRLGQWP